VSLRHGWASAWRVYRESQFNYDTELDSRDWLERNCLTKWFIIAVRVPR